MRVPVSQKKIVLRVMLVSRGMALIVLMTMNVTTIVITATQMLHVRILLVHSHVNVTLVSPGMGLLVRISMNAMTIPMAVIPMLLVPIQSVVMPALVTMVMTVMVAHALVSTNS